MTSNSEADESDIPEGWAKTALRDLVEDVQPGFACGTHNREGEGVAHIRPMNVSGEGRMNLSVLKFVPKAQADRDERWVRPGDVIFNNTNSPELVGKTALYTLPDRRAFSNHMTRVRCKRDAIDPAYCAAYLHQQWRTGYFLSVCNNHVSQASVASGVLLETEINLPPLAEQRRIVAKVEELLARVNAGRERLAKVPAILKRFRQSILAAACCGQLTADWRVRNPSPPTVAESLTTGYDNVPELPPLPESWSYAKCDSLCDPERSLTYGVIKLGAEIPDGIPTLRSSDVRWLRIHETGIKRISPTIAKEYSRTFLSGGEIVVTVRGTLGGIAVVPRHMRGFNVSREVAVIPLGRPWNGHFFAVAIASQGSQNWLSGVAKGVAYTGVNIADLKCLPLPVPPISEQAEIVRRVEALFALADKIEARVQAATARVEKITQAILAKAFRGELVPTEAKIARDESRPYEPASELLARIRADRQAAATTAPSRRRAKTVGASQSQNGQPKRAKPRKAGAGRSNSTQP